MTRMIRGSVLLAACVGLWSCSSDPTADEAGVPDKIVSLPSVVFVKQDSSELVAFQLVDALDGQIPTEWTVDASSPQFTVTFDSTYRPIYNPDGTLTLPGQQTQARVTVHGVLLGADTITVSASGKSLEIPIYVVPGTLHAVFSPANPAPGDTVTMTMPPELRLSPTSAITFAGNQDPILIDRAVDSTSLRFISAPTTATVATVTKIYDKQTPTVPVFTLNSEAKLIGTMSGAFTGTLPATFSTLAPTGPPVIMTANAGFGFLPTTTISFPLQTSAVVNTVSADSTVVNFSVAPNVNAKPEVNGVFFLGARQFVYDLPYTQYMISPVVSNFPATLSNNSPQIGQPITLTAGAGYSFAPGATVIFGTNAAIVAGNTGATLTLYPAPGSSGNLPKVTNVVDANYPAFKITLPAQMPAALAMQATVVAVGQGGTSRATAPLIPPAGLYDKGSFGGAADCNEANFCQLYKINVPAGVDSLNFTLTWANTADLGLYFQDATGADMGVVDCDAHGSGAASQPETCTIGVVPGTMYLEVDLYGAFANGPTWIGLSFR